MEFKKNKSSKNTGGLAKSSGGKVTPIRKGGNGSFNLNPTSVSGSQVLAVNPQAQSMLESLFGEFGLQLPELNMGDPNLSKKVVEIGKVAEVARKNKAAVRTLLKHVGALMSAEVTKAQFYDAATQIVIEGKRTIDRATANAFLSLYNYNKSVDHLQGAVERKTQAIDAQYEYLGQMGDKRLQSGINWIKSKEQQGAKRITENEKTRKQRATLFSAVQSKRAKDVEYARYGHLEASKDS